MQQAVEAWIRQEAIRFPLSPSGAAGGELDDGWAGISSRRVLGGADEPRHGVGCGSGPLVVLRDDRKAVAESGGHGLQPRRSGCVVAAPVGFEQRVVDELVQEVVAELAEPMVHQELMERLVLLELVLIQYLIQL